MSRRRLQAAAAAIVIVALALLVGGLAVDRAWIWGGGLAAVAVAMVLSFVAGRSAAGDD